MRTRILGIIGDPVEHSLSPVMQRAALREKGIPLLYFPFRVCPGELEDFMHSLRRSDLAGLNVTIPHKEAALNACDWIEPAARKIGAVNTIVVREGRLFGYNTDWVGYLHSLRKEARFEPTGKKVILLGAGGAARAVLFALGQARVKEISIANRTRSRGKDLVGSMRRFFPKTDFKTLPPDRKTLARVFPKIDLLINATSAGMRGEDLRLPLALLPRHALVSDLVYSPRLTPLLKAARKRGLRIHTGLGMLIRQGALSFKLWTGKRPNLDVMRRAVLKTFV